jgi:PTS system mannose-specific IIA component
MIGVVLVTHGNLAGEFENAVEHVVGPQEQFAKVCIGPEDDMEQRRKDILDRVADVDTGDGVIIVTDMFGGTPSNLSISVMETGRVEILAGMNLPMLIKLARARVDKPMDQVLSLSCEAGRKYVNVASQILAGK